MIGGDGINDESNKTAPPPVVAKYLERQEDSIGIPTFWQIQDRFQPLQVL
jgi:hypothetical protein